MAPSPPPVAAGGPLRMRDFRLLLAGAAAGQAGAQVTLVALPLVAVLVLKAPAFEVGLLTAAETAAFLLIGLPAGAWVDRMRKLPLMIRADAVRAVAMASVPLAGVTGVLTMAQLYVVALITGAATVFFDVAHQSYLPELLPKEQLMAGNGALETVRSSAQVAGPGLGGGLVQLVGAHLAIVADAIGYAVSALFLLAMKRPPESRPEPVAGTSLRKDIAEGLRFVLGHPLLRVIAATTGLGNFFIAMLMATQTIFLVRVIGLEPGAVGLMLSASAVGGLLGALSAGTLAGRIGQARIIWLSALATGPFALLWPLSGRGATAALFAIGSGVVSFGAVVYNVAQVSFRQTLCPPRLLGRMNATLRFLVWGTLPLGAVVGGALAGAFGARAALWVCAIGFLVVPLPLLCSPLRRMRDLPAAPDDRAPDDPDTRGSDSEPVTVG